MKEVLLVDILPVLLWECHGTTRIFQLCTVAQNKYFDKSGKFFPTKNVFALLKVKENGTKKFCARKPLGMAVKDAKLCCFHIWEKGYQCKVCVKEFNIQDIDTLEAFMETADGNWAAQNYIRQLKNQKKLVAPIIDPQIVALIK